MLQNSTYRYQVIMLLLYQNIIILLFASVLQNLMPGFLKHYTCLHALYAYRIINSTCHPPVKFLLSSYIFREKSIDLFTITTQRTSVGYLGKKISVFPLFFPFPLNLCLKCWSWISHNDLF